MKGLSLINKLLYFLNSISLFLLLFSYLSPYISPTHFWPISFIGLIFPILYITNSLFLIYWLIGFKKPMWANTIILLIGIGNISNYLGTSPNNISSNENIKVLTYNVRLFNKYNWLNKPNVKEEIFSFLKTENPDILCIQEFYTADEIPNLNYAYRHIGLQNKKSQWHMAIYSNYTQIKKETVSIQGERMNNTCIYSDMLIKGDTIRIYNIHLASNWFNSSDYSFIQNPQKGKFKESVLGITKKMKNSYKKRAKEVDMITEHMGTSPYPLIVCGDFNDTPLSYAYHSIKGNLLDAFSFSGKGIGTSFIKIPALRIDYILHDAEFKSTNYQKHNQILSDHYAVSCEITTP
ncbi:MAG: endonuclease/exonuclease/phosphatase family protein [Bacteroidota bacterium]|nr:endonuclease/exonuclease/phosphatase family protein [Bacteroidota bacterium]